MNEVSTRVPAWQINCEKFQKVGQTFQLRDVETDEHWNFVSLFCARFGWIAKGQGTTVVFSPPIEFRTGQSN
jgi:hypothetical protein